MRIAIGLLAALSMLAVPSRTHAAACPASVTEAALAAHPGATVASCKQEREHGRTQYEVNLAAKEGGTLELDVAADGKILLTEEPISIGDVPAAVTQAFARMYPNVRATGAEKETSADGKITYELAFEASGKKKEATFAADGTFVEAE